MSPEKQENTNNLKQEIDMLHNEKTREQMGVFEELRKTGISEEEIENLKQKYTKERNDDEKMHNIRQMLHEEYDKKTHHTKEEIARYNYIQDLEKIENIKKEFPLLKEKQNNLHFWEIGKIRKVKNLRKELASLYTKLQKAVSDYEYTTSRKELFK